MSLINSFGSRSGVTLSYLKMGEDGQPVEEQILVFPVPGTEHYGTIDGSVHVIDQYSIPALVEEMIAVEMDLAAQREGAEPFKGHQVQAFDTPMPQPDELAPSDISSMQFRI